MLGVGLAVHDFRIGLISLLWTFCSVLGSCYVMSWSLGGEGVRSDGEEPVCTTMPVLFLV